MIDNANGMGTTMLVQPTGASAGGLGDFGGGGWWLILFVLLFGMGGFGNGFGGGMDNIYPWMNNSQNINDGFRDQFLNTQVTGIGDRITSGLGDIAMQLNNGFNQTQISALQSTNAIQSQLAQCCCDNRMATVQTQNVVQSEGAATRAAIQAQTQAILDKMCQQEIDNLKAQNLALQNQLNIANLAASQTAQTAQLIADNTAQTQYIVNRVAPYPIPAYTVANPATPAA